MDRLIRSGGTPTDIWTTWLQPLGSSAALAGPPHTARLVVVAPHPDDEILACAGLLQQHHAHGGGCSILAISDGEASHREVPGADPEALRFLRRQESRQGLEQLGLADAVVTRLKLPDGEVSNHPQRLMRGLLVVLRPRDWVVTTWRLDGHPDHEATGDAVARVCALMGCHLLEAPVWMWNWATPGQPGIPWHRLRVLALRPEEIEAKRRALACHRSQLAPRGEAQPPVLDAELLARSSWPGEYFFAEEAT